MLLMSEVAGWVKQWVNDWFLRKVGANTYKGTLTVTNDAGTVTTVLPDAGLTSLAGLGTAADKTIYTTAIDTWAETPLTAFGRSLIDDAAATNARTTLGLVIGTDVQAQDAELQAIAGLTSAADRVPYFTGLGTAALATLTAAGRALIDDATAGDQRTTLGLGTIATEAATAFLRLLGVAGGQAAYGGTASGNDLVLRSTSDVTKGYVIISDDGGQVTVGTATPLTSTELTVAGDINASAHIATQGRFYAMGVGDTPYATNSEAVIVRHLSSIGEVFTAMTGTGTQRPLRLFATAAATNQVYLNTDGNIGVGTSDIEAWDASYRAMQLGSHAAIMWGNASAPLYSMSNAYFDGAWKLRTAAVASLYTQSAGAHYLNTAPTGDIDSTITWVTQMTTNATGVGVKIAPSVAFHVEGESRIQGTEAGDGILGIYADQGDDDADRWRITARELAGTYAELTFASYGPGSWEDQLVLGRNQGSGVSYAQILALGDTTTASAGNVYSGTTGTIARSTSAARYKTNVRNLPDPLGLRLVRKLRPVVFNSTCEIDSKTDDFVGFIAEDVDALGAKPLVFYGPDGQPEGVQYDRLTTVLVSAVQELDRQVKELQAKVAKLEGI